MRVIRLLLDLESAVTAISLCSNLFHPRRTASHAVGLMPVQSARGLELPLSTVGALSGPARHLDTLRR
jgi:hypothetical protein